MVGVVSHFCTDFLRHKLKYLAPPSGEVYICVAILNILRSINLFSGPQGGKYLRVCSKVPFLHFVPAFDPARVKKMEKMTKDFNTQIVEKFWILNKCYCTACFHSVLLSIFFAHMHFSWCKNSKFPENFIWAPLPLGRPKKNLSNTFCHLFYIFCKPFYTFCHPFYTFCHPFYTFCHPFYTFCQCCVSGSGKIPDPDPVSTKRTLKFKSSRHNCLKYSFVLIIFFLWF